MKGTLVVGKKIHKVWNLLISISEKIKIPMDLWIGLLCNDWNEFFFLFNGYFFTIKFYFYIIMKHSIRFFQRNIIIHRNHRYIKTFFQKFYRQLKKKTALFDFYLQPYCQNIFPPFYFICDFSVITEYCTSRRSINPEKTYRV